MDTGEQVLALVQQALADLDNCEVRLSSVARKAVRIARLRGDYENLYWLAMELRTLGDQEAKHAIYYEVAPHLTKAVHRNSVNSYVARRTSKNIKSEGVDPDVGGVLPFGLAELESRIENLKQSIQDLATPTSLASSDYVYLEKQQGGTRTELHVALTEWSATMQRIAHAVYDYLSRTEQQVFYGQANSDLFEQNRRFVDDRLNQLAPAALVQFRAAVERLKHGGAEASSHALTSCRRILKTMADHLYPPGEKPIVGHDGKARVLSEEKYVSRLWQYVHDKVSGTASRKLLGPQIEELCNRIDRLNELSSKGVHADVNPFEAHQCVLQTYLLAGDLLRIAEGNSEVERSVEEADRLYPEPAPNPSAAPDGWRRR